MSGDVERFAEEIKKEAYLSDTQVAVLLPLIADRIFSASLDSDLRDEWIVVAVNEYGVKCDEKV